METFNDTDSGVLTRTCDVETEEKAHCCALLLAPGAEQRGSSWGVGPSPSWATFPGHLANWLPLLIT